MTYEGTPRPGDARADIPQLLEEAPPSGVIRYRNVYTGEPIANPEFILDAAGKRRHIKAAPPLTLAEQQKASTDLQGLFENTENFYPQLTAAMLRNPDSLWLLPELQLMLSNGGETASYDFAADLASAILEDPASPGALSTYHSQTSKNQTQELFWSEIGNRYDEMGKAQLVAWLSQVSEDGANNVASLAMAWAQGKDLEDEATRAQLIFNINNWAYSRQQSELGNQGFFGFLDAPQQFVEDVVVRPIIDAGISVLSSPEEAARRKGLTIGQQAAYFMGMRPPDAGQFGSWEMVTGAVDAYSEISLDPYSWLAALGLSSKAVRTIPLVGKAVEAGRIARAARAMLPKFMSGSARAASGGRVARVLYSFRAKTYDELFERMATSGVAEDILKVVKSGNYARLNYQYPQFANMGDDMWAALNLAETPEEAVQVFRHGNLVDVLRHGDELERVELEAAQAWRDYKVAFDESVARGTISAPTDLAADRGLLQYGVAHRELAMEALNKQTRLDTLMARDSQAFIIFDIPQRSKKVFNWRNLTPKSTGRVATATRQAAARLTPGQIPDEIDLFNSRKGANQLRLMFEHFGMAQAKIDDVVSSFVQKEIGERQIWFFDEALPALGEAIGIPALQYDLVTFYKKSGIRSFAASGLDQFEDAATGLIHRSPIIPTHLQAKVPISVRELEAIVRRSRSIQNRSKLAKAIGWNGRGLGDSQGERLQLVNRFRAQLADKDMAGAMTDEQLWNMAYSYVDTATNAIDGRGWWAGLAAPKIGSVWDGFHRFFTKNMLIFRPFQWSWRVALLEEPIRASIFNLSSMYRNPLAYMTDLRDAHYLTKLKAWREANLGWADGVYQGFVTGVKNIDEGAEKLRAVGLLDDIFPEGLPRTMSVFKEAVASFLDDAVRDRTRVTKIQPIHNVTWAVKNRAVNIARAEAKLTSMGLPSSFDLVDDIPEIQQKMMHVYLAGAVGASDIRNAQWATGMLDSQARNYGKTLGAKLIEFAEDPMGKIGLRRLATNLRAGTMDGTIQAEAIVNSSRWVAMRGILRQRFPMVEDDIELASRYMDEILEPEAHELFRFVQHLPADQQADIVDDFVKNRRLRMNLEGSEYDINLKSGNYGKATRDVGEMVSTHSRSQTVKFAENLPAPAFDPRFMAGDDPGMLKKLGDKVLKTFGEGASQVLNRRPAWIREYSRWFERYKALGIPEELIGKMAREHASQMINHVYYNIDEAPYLVGRLNRYIPFFGATYEVLSAWTYKMPVAVGGSWPLGVGEFARKFDRLLDAFVNMGIVTRVEEEDGSISYMLHLQPVDEATTPMEIGQFFRGAGYSAIRTLESTIGTILGMQEGLGLRSPGYQLTLGNPVDLTDYGVLSFAQANLGMSPTANFGITKLAALIPGAGDSERTAVGENESLTDLAERMDEDPIEIIKMNRGAIIDTLGSDQYNAILAGLVLPDEIVLPTGLPLEVPNTNLYSNVIEDFIQPFGAIEDPKDFMMSFMPGVLRWGLAGIGIQNQPTDAFYEGDYQGLFAGMLPAVNQSQMSSQISEAFMYVESFKRYPSGESRFGRILRKQGELATMRETTPSSPEADKLKAEIDVETEEFLALVQRTAGESLLLRSVTGSFLPTSPGQLRQEQEMIQGYWNSRDYADSVRMGVGDLTIQPFKSMADVDKFFAQVGAWMEEPTGDAAKARFLEDNPTLMAYLTPKSFYGTEGVPPEVGNIQEYQRQIESGERITSPLHVTIYRYRSAAIQADFHNQIIARYGNDPVAAAAAALSDYQGYRALQDEKNLSYQAMYMQDDMHGHLYSDWQRDRFQDDSWSLETTIEDLNTIRDNLALVMTLEDNLDVEMDLEGIKGLNTGLRAAMAEISKGIRNYEANAEASDFRNPYEDAINRYFTEVYIPYQEGLTALYDELETKPDSEQQSLIYERIKIYKNEFSNSTFFLEGNTTSPFPSPMEIQWSRRDEAERTVKVQQWLTRPLLWLDQDSAQRIVERNPQMSSFLPTTDEQFTIYREWTITKETVGEMLESNQITVGQSRKMLENLDMEMNRRLLAEGRGGELAYMQMTPYEQLELSGELNPQLGMFGDYLRYYKQILEVEEESPGSTRGRVLVAPLYEMAKAAAYANPDVMNGFRDLGENLMDKTTLDNILPWLFFGTRSEF